MPEPSGIITMIGFPDLEEPPLDGIPPKSPRGMMSRVAGKVCWQTAEIGLTYVRKCQVTHSGLLQEHTQDVFGKRLIITHHSPK
jgi:hypothetical protein